MTASARPRLGRLFPTSESRAFLRWGVGTYVVVTAVLLATSLRASRGTLIYALDDPAIHLSLATNLVEHGTWGVSPGAFQSASSSPLWTVLLGAVVTAFPFAADAAALILNVAAALVVIAVFARTQSVLHPSLKRPLDAAAVVALVAVVLFLPGATFVGMEHLLHTALVLVAFILLFRDVGPGRSRWRRALPYLCIALATFTRMETAFLAVGVAAAILLTVDRSGPDLIRRLKEQLPRVVGLGLASGIPVAAFAAFNRAMGQGWLPNSVIAKSESLNGENSDSPVVPDLADILGRFTQDPVLALVVGLCLVLLVVGWTDRRGWVAPAIAVASTTLLHVTFADVGWFERYQIYLIALALSVLLLAARDLTAERGPWHLRPRLLPALVLMVLLFSTTKVALTVEVPHAVEDTYAQRYQAALFLDRYYGGEPIATGELGYISLEHDGPLTDLLGLGDYAVLQGRRATPLAARDEYWAKLAQERGFAVAAVYPTTLLFETPEEWTLVGTWELEREPITAFDRKFQFWATRPEEVAPLIEHLREFESELPDVVDPSINDLAQLRADQMISEAADGPP